MIERRRTLKSGKVWIGYYYDGRDSDGKRKELPLGTDLVAAKRKWAEYESKPVPAEAGTMSVLFDKYIRDEIPKKAARTQENNLAEIENLRAHFGTAPIGAILPRHVAAYRDNRKTKRRLRADGSVRDPGGKPAPVAANRELALLSHVMAKAREWGYTDKANPVTGISKNKETPRDFYVDDEVWAAVYGAAVAELQDAMDLAYLTGQRPGDVLKFTIHNLTDTELQLRQGKTGKLLRIRLVNDGSRNFLGQVIDRIRSRKVRGAHLLMTSGGLVLNRGTLRKRFTDARNAAIAAAMDAGRDVLAARIRQYQFRDTRAKAASDVEDLATASKLLGHSKEEITQLVYRRRGEVTNPTR
jgi:integrase